MGFWGNFFHREGGKPGPSEADDLGGILKKKTGFDELKPKVPLAPLSTTPEDGSGEPQVPLADVSTDDKVAARDVLSASIAESEAHQLEEARIKREQHFRAGGRADDAPRYIPTEITRRSVEKVAALDTDPDVRAHDRAIENIESTNRMVEAQLKQGVVSPAGKEYLKTSATILKQWMRDDRTPATAEVSQPSAAILAELDRLANQYGGAPSAEKPNDETSRSQPRATSAGGGINMNSEIDSW